MEAAGRQPARVPQVAGELIATRRVGAYQHLTFVAPGVAELARPGPVRRAGRRRRHLRDPAAPLLLDPQGRARRAPTAAPSTSWSPRTGRAPGGSTELRAARHGRHRRPAGRAVPAAHRAGRLRPGRWRLRQRAAVLARRRAARAGLPRRDGARRGQRGPALRRRRGPARGRRRHRHHRRRLGRARGAGSPTCCPRSSAAPVPASSTAAARWPCSARSPRSPRPQGAVAQVAVEESMACGVGVCMTCVMPVVGDDGRTRMVRSCVEGPDLPRRPGALGRVRRRACGRVPGRRRRRTDGREATDEHRTRRTATRRPLGGPGRHGVALGRRCPTR